MDPVVITDAQRGDVAPLAQLEGGVVTDLCGLVLSQGRPDAPDKRKAFLSAGKKLGIPADALQRASASLCHILTLAARSSLPADQTEQRLGLAGLPQATCREVAQFYTNNLEELRDLLGSGDSARPLYGGMSWRLDVRLASRSCQQEAAPSFLLQLRTHKEGRSQETFLEADLQSMQTLRKQVEEALKTTGSAHSRRLRRYMR